MPARLEGLYEAQAKINAAIRAAGDAAKQELIEFCMAVMGLAVRKAPVETGDLRGGFVIEIDGERWAHTESDASGAINIVQDRSDMPTAASDIRVYIGTSGIPYAARQHEELTYRHPRGGEAKFLENALNDLLPQLTAQLQEAVRKGARGE